MQKRFLFFILLLSSFAQSFADKDYRYHINLTNVSNDKLIVELTPPEINAKEIVFNFPAMVPGTYAVYNFGRFVSNFKVKGKNGAEIKVEKLSADSYKLSPADQIELISYEVEDSFDTNIKENVVFEPAGTNIDNGKNFVINTHGFFGYFTGMTNANFILEFNKPAGFYPSTGLSNLKIGETKDEISVYDYHDLIDSPIMYCKPDTTVIQVANTRVLVSVYSPTRKINSAFAARTLKELLFAQRDFLGGELPVDKYAFLIYLSDVPTLSGSNGALEHSYSSFYVMPEIDTATMAPFCATCAPMNFFTLLRR